MKFIPIPYSPMMVDAIIGDSKTMTRRTNGLELVNNDPDGYEFMFELDYITNGGKTGLEFFFTESYGLVGTKSRYGQRCPYGQIGDVLWVREEHLITINDEAMEVRIQFKDGVTNLYYYKDLPLKTIENLAKRKTLGKWQRARFMPKAMARIFLEITNIRVERLRDITWEDAIAEGIKKTVFPPTGRNCYYFYPCNDLRDDSYLDNPIVSFYSLWKSINRDESWDENPWVWVIEFKRIAKPSNFL